MVADRIRLPSFAVRRLAGFGFEPARVFARAGIPPALLAQRKIFVTTRQFFALWEAVEALSGDPAIGLRFGAEWRPDQIDPATAIALHSDTFGDALRRLARYKHLVCPEEVRIEIAGGLAALQFRWILSEEPVPRVLIDSIFAGIHALARYACNKPMVPQRIELARPGRRSEAHERHFGCPIVFDALRDALVYHAAALDEPFVTRNAELVEALTPGLDAQVHAAALAGEPLDRQVSAVLARMMRGQRPNIDAVARELFTSARTLQRRLGELGTSYQSILDGVRRETAKHLLGSTDLEQGEIAFYLGFEEVNSFARAFQKWEKRTPAQWRAEHDSPAA